MRNCGNCRHYHFHGGECRSKVKTKALWAHLPEAVFRTALHVERKTMSPTDGTRCVCWAAIEGSAQ